jgi:hypothetical protein
MPAIIKPHEKTAASRVLIQAGWDDVPHLDEEAKAELLEETPEWIREARSLGKPSIGSGAIYPIPEAKIRVDPFPIPDHWPRCYALDVGWNWTAVLWEALERETATRYIYGEYLAGQEKATIHAAAIKARGEWIHGLIDPSANNRGQRDGETLMADYIGEGLVLTKANNAVEAGLVKTWRDLSIGRTKIFSTLQNFFAEYRLYHRDENGKIVKKKDHLMDCMRYLHNSAEDVRRVRPARGGVSTASARPATPGGY